MTVEVKKRLRSMLHTCVFILLGNGLLAFLVAAFVIPHDIIMGGTTGIGIVLNNFLGFDTALIVLILNVLLLILGAVVLGKKFFVTTVASSVLYPVLLGIMQRIPGIETITDNTLLATIVSGALMGIALGLVLRVGASTGGTDITSLIMHKWFHLPVSVCIYINDTVVIGGQALFSSRDQILYGVLFLVIMTIVLEQVMILGQSQIQVFAISEQHEQIRRKILTELQAGVTMLQIETGCLGQQQQGVLCVIPARKLYSITELIQSIDPNVFMTVTKIKEVRGQGFTRERKVLAYRPGMLTDTANSENRFAISEE